MPPNPAPHSPAPAPAPDETVRMRGDEVSGRPQPDGTRAAPATASPGPAVAQTKAGPTEPTGEVDDTRPVTRDWLQGAPDPVPGHGPADPPEIIEPAPAAVPAGATAGWTSTRTSPETGPTGLLPRSDDSDIDGPRTPVDDGPPSGGSRAPRRRRVLTPLLVLAVLAVLYGVDLLVSRGSVARSTVVAGVDIGGMSPAAAAHALESRLGPKVAADRRVVAQDIEATLSPAVAGITLDVDSTVDRADDQPLNPWTRLTSLFSDHDVEPVLTVDETALTAQLDGIAEQVDRAPVDATITIDGTTPHLVDPAEGRRLDRDAAADALTGALAAGTDPAETVELPVRISPAHVDTATAQRVLDETVTPALAAPVEVVSEDGSATVDVPVTAIAASLTFTPQESGDLDVSIDPANLQTALGDELTKFGAPAKDARFEVSGGTVSVVPSVDGTGIDPTALAEKLVPVLAAPQPRSVTAALGPVPADFTTEEAEGLGIKEEISTFTTHYTAQASGTNMRTAAAKIDGTVVLPGETFSLNEATGPRGLAQGYVEAGVISGGDFTTSVGGGVSQLATTMFNAVFFAGLEDVHHKPHSYYISRYPPGREATVWYDDLDLAWRNDSETGVLVDTAWEPGSLTVTFYGTKRYEIESITSDRYDLTSPAVQEKPDDGDCHAAAGSSGFSVTVTRVFRDLTTGAEIKREEFRTRYAAQPNVRCVATAAPAPADAGGAAEAPPAD
jgi:vancomycin resistance protein YoaR